jgi:hypothetical protein
MPESGNLAIKLGEIFNFNHFIEPPVGAKRLVNGK